MNSIGIKLYFIDTNQSWFVMKFLVASRKIFSNVSEVIENPVHG